MASPELRRLWQLHQVDKAILEVRQRAANLDVGQRESAVLAKLESIGVKRVEWLLLTDHHREQVQGIERLDRAVAFMDSLLRTADEGQILRRGVRAAIIGRPPKWQCTVMLR